MDKTEIDGAFCARLFKYFMQERTPYLKFKRRLCHIKAKGCYESHKDAFDRTAEFFASHGLNLEKYMQFFVLTLCKNESDVDGDLCAFQTVRRFADEIQIREGHEKVYRWVLRSARNLAELCAANGISTAREGLVYLIKNGMLAAWYMSGKMSNYFLAGIPRFDKVVKRMDDMSQNEMRDLTERFDMYQKKTDESFKYVKNMKANPIRIADNFLSKLRSGV